MSRHSVAVLDIRSSEVSILVGERGVNDTFVFHASCTKSYNGYDETGAFYSEEDLSRAVLACIQSAEKTINSRIKQLYVGVPGAFLTVVPAEQSSGFSKRRRITARETEALFERGKTALDGYRLIRATSMIYTTADNRRVIDPIGLSSTSLTSALSYFYCKQSFAETVERILKGMKIAVAYLPTQLAMASYLIPAETRDECAIFFDCGYLSSTISIVLGGGILAQETYWVGKIRVVVRLMERFHLEYAQAVALLEKANLSIKDVERLEFLYGDDIIEIDTVQFVEAVKEGLDEICEAINGFVDECSGRELDFKPVYVSGEGLTDVRGALEHIAKRINRMTEMTSPHIPYYNRPSMSSRIALMDMACEDQRRGGIRKRF